MIDARSTANGTSVAAWAGAVAAPGMFTCGCNAGSDAVVQSADGGCFSANHVAMGYSPEIGRAHV